MSSSEEDDPQAQAEEHSRMLSTGVKMLLNKIGGGEEENHIGVDVEMAGKQPI